VTAPLIAAVDIGASKTLVTVRSTDALDGGWSDTEVVRCDTDRDPVRLAGWIADEVRRLADAGDGTVAAVGVAAPGPLDATRGVVTRSSNLGWDDVPLATLLHRRLRAPVRLEDDANTAAIGEWRYGAGRGRDPIAYLTVSSGVGGAIVVRGEVVRGATGNAGEVGHLAVTATGPRCACGRRGDVESYAGGAAIARRARRAWPSSNARHAPPPRSAEDVFRAARHGDAAATVIAEEAAAGLSVALAALASVLEPEAIVVGGAIGLAQPRLIRRATTLARRRVLAENARSMQVVPAALADGSVLAGAAHLARKQLATG
jgi:glucokinase